MMNSRITRIIANTVGLAAIAALGITVYQLGTSPVKEKASEEKTTQTEQEENSMIDAGTNQVEADMNNQNDVIDSIDSVSETDKEENSIGENMEDINEAEDVSAQVSALPEVNFSEDTLMEWPVNGNILVDYSMDQTTYFPTLDQYKLSPAISVGAVEGAPVVAAVNGKVFSIEQDAQTGTTLTMELGNGYQAVYGQLTDLKVSEGDTVKKGMIIGYIAQPTKYYSTEGSNLYFAMKKDGKPIDPIAYLP
ncbi:MAG: M23 family metallopeptidase [Blautia sp.]|nr:M23 family metallopeptidase [Blautia sp.]